MAIRLSHTEVHTCTHMDDNRALGFIVLVISGCEFVCVCNTIRAVCDTMKTNRLKDRGTHSGGESTSRGINKWVSRKSRAHSLQFSWLQAYRIILYWNIDKISLMWQHKQIVFFFLDICVGFCPSFLSPKLLHIHLWICPHRKPAHN